MLTTYRRLDRRRLAAWWRSDPPTPMYVLNLLELRRRGAYRAYGAVVLPLLLAHGGRPIYAGRHERALLGEPQAGELLVVRYPSHRRFTAMVLNPAYQPANALRRAGVARFHAGFMAATERGRKLRRLPSVVVAHADGAPAAVAGAFAELARELGAPALVLRQSAVFDLLAPPEPTDPNPPRHPDVALFAAPAAHPPAERLAALGAGLADLSIQRYRTLAARDLLR